jgi:hypothetical protein
MEWVAAANVEVDKFARLIRDIKHLQARSLLRKN